MIILRDKHNNAYGSSIHVTPTSEGISIYATSDYDGGALVATWVLKPADTFTFASRIHGTSTYSPSSSSYFGTLLGFDGPAAVQQITINGTNTVTFIPNIPNTAVKTVHAILTCSVGGSTASLRIEVQPLSVGS